MVPRQNICIYGNNSTEPLCTVSIKNPVHQVCRKASQSKRDVFDAQAQRLHGTEAAEVILRQPSREQFNNAKELVRRTNQNVGNLGKELITTLADWKSMEHRREMERDRPHVMSALKWGRGGDNQKANDSPEPEIKVCKT